VRIGVLAIALALLVTGCGSSDGTPAEGDANALKVTRDDGSTVEFPKQVRAWCDAYRNSEGDPVGDGPETVYVLGGDPPDSDEPEAFWIFSRAVEDIERSPRLEFSHEEGSHAALFVLDPKLKYELSSMEEHSSGSLTVEEWGCEKGDAVRISVDGKLESEVHDEESLTPVKGEIVATIGDPVPLYDD
jgi:hypothetical protein